MSKKDYPLPEYSNLIRWTIVNVKEWLTMNGLGSCVMCFSKMGVDGNKLVHITKSDLEKIGCPKTLIRIILDHVAQVQKPGSKRPEISARHTFVQAAFHHNFEDDEESELEDDTGDWLDGEFYDDISDDWDNGRHLPVLSAESSVCVDLKANLKVSKIHKRPLPKPPIETTETSLVIDRPVPAPSPKFPAKKFPEPVETIEKNHEDPVLIPPIPPPPKGRVPVPFTSPCHRASPIDTPQNLVKKKDLPQPVSSQEKKQPEKPKPSLQQEDEDYLDMSTDTGKPPLPPTRVKTQPKNKPQYPPVKSPQYPPSKETPTPPYNKPRYQPSKSPQYPLPEDTQDDYKQPKDVSAVPPPRTKEKQNGVQANNLPVPSSQPKQPAQSLPPTPSEITLPKPDIETQPTKMSVLPVEGNEGDITTKNWFHGNITRAEAEERLKQKNINGMYLIRQSKQGGDKPYTLQIYFNGKCYNLPIRVRSDNRYAIGQERVDEKSFSTLTGMINMLKLNALVLQGGKGTKLKKSLPKD